MYNFPKKKNQKNQANTMKNKFDNWTITELIKELEKFSKKKKYGLVWEDKPEDVVNQCKEKYPVLEEVKDKELKDKSSYETNLLIEGDNYHALSVLNYTHQKKIDFIYIDPPYNTGSKDWKYNNNYVDKEDPYRHSKWISFLYHRLLLAKDLLKNNGIICVTIDDYEMPRLWLLMEEIFGEANNLGIVAIRNNPKGRKTERKVSLVHEYAIFFGRTKHAKIKKLEVEIQNKTHNYKKDENDEWYLPTNLRKPGADSLAKRKNGKISDRYYPIYVDSKTGEISVSKKFDIEIYPVDANDEKRIWRRSKDVIEKMYKEGDLWHQKIRGTDQIQFKFRGGLDGEPPQSLWIDSRFSASEHGTKVLDLILGSREKFNYPKSAYAVEECIKIACKEKNAVILDFFGGSGTTGHAVLEMNKRDNGNRQFILCTNNENDIANDVCYPRLSNVIKGYQFKGVNKEIIFEKKLNEKVLRNIDDSFEYFDSIKEEFKDKYTNYEIKVESDHLRLYGLKKISGKKDGLGGNLKYFKTAFVEAGTTDKNKINLTKKAVEMLCVKENTFDSEKINHNYKIFKNQNNHMAIIFDHKGIEDFIQHIEHIDNFFRVYIFTLSDDDFFDEFEHIKHKIKIIPIPESILRIYRRVLQKNVA
jgi:adenine-specific DNA-methyltransferase